MKASVIITTYQRPIFLHRAINSLLTQTCKDFEIIIVDDNGLGTTDQLVTQEILNPHENRTVYLALEKNSGACEARNRGVAIAKGEYIFFLDDDDEFLPQKVETQVKFLEENKVFDGCLSAFKRLSDDGKEIVAESNFPRTGNFKDFVLNGNFFTPMLCIRKSSLEQMGGFKNIPRFQDRYLMLHCLQKNFHFADLQEQLYIMYEHGGERVTHINVSKSIESLDIIRAYISKFKKDFPAAEYAKYILKDERMRATIYYVAKRRWLSFRNWLDIFLVTKCEKDFIMIFKSLVK